MGALKKRFREIKKLPGWVYVFPELLVRGWLGLCRLKIHDPHGLIKGSKGEIPLLWHNRLIFFPLVFPKAVRKRTVALISPSRDGQYIADFAGRFGVRALRGSSNKKGAMAQRQALRELEEMNHVVFTPDGPRGPKYHLHSGPVHLAMLSGRVIIPLSINASRYWQLRSWDNFQLPKPFSRIDVVVGAPIKIAPDLTPEQLETERRRVEEALLAITVDRSTAKR